MGANSDSRDAENKNKAKFSVVIIELKPVLVFQGEKKRSMLIRISNKQPESKG